MDDGILLTNTQYETQQSNSNKCKCKSCKGSIIIILSFAFILIGGGLIYFLLFYDKTKSDSSTSNNTSYDYVVIGSGPSGSIVSTRLAQNGYSVLLLEAGNTTQYSLNGTNNVSSNTNLTLFDIPLDWDIITVNTTYSSQYLYSPKGMNISPLIGRGIGGSGAINAMIYIRGTITDFTSENGWIESWNNYTNILKYYMRSENNTDFGSNSSYHSNAGNVHISHNYDSNNNSLSSIFIKSCESTNYSIINDFNTPFRPHNICGNYQFLIDNFHDDTNQTIRDSVARAFYRNDIKPNSLTIQPNSMAINIIFDPNKKTKAIGVNYIDLSNNNKLQQVLVNKEVIISAGTLNTPTILMQSGIGNASLLMDKFGYNQSDIILNNTQIGNNYIDGVFTYIQWNVSDNLIQNFTLCTPWNTTFGGDKYDFTQCQLNWMQYIQTTKREKKNIFDTTGFNVGGFFKSPYSNNTQSNDIQITLQPYDILLKYNQSNIITAQIANNLPKSKGKIGWNYLNNINSLDKLIINGSNILVYGNYLSDDTDINALIFGINVTRNIFNAAPMKDYIINELFPGKNVNNTKDLKQFVIDNKESADHLVGTCKLGDVVDTNLSIIGLDNIRIVDGSIMPQLPSGNTHATCMMIGEYAAQLILNQYN